mmetsp:Transcript_54305/g.62732  ORF Transcript_54305/g.62732 Transcript_54305/m.62732 type:complete len:85 (+) Transcript_54305:224-478(+)
MMTLLNPLYVGFLFITIQNLHAEKTEHSTRCKYNDSKILWLPAQSPKLKKGIIATVTAAVPTVFTSVAAMATDGTNEFVVHWGT